MMRILEQLCLLLTAVATVRGSKEIGELSTLVEDYGVKGTVFVVDETTIRIENFHYTGTGPDAYFYVGKDDEPNKDGMMATHDVEGGENMQKLPKGRAFGGENITLTMPDGISTSQVKWLSVWCKIAGVNFGDVFFDAIEMEMNDDKDSQMAANNMTSAGTLTGAANNLGGSVYFLDATGVLIKDFTFNGEEKDAFFYGDSKGSPNIKQGIALVHNLTSESDPQAIPSGTPFSGASVLVTLKDDLTTSNLKWIAIFNKRTEAVLADLMIKKLGIESNPDIETEVKDEGKSEPEKPDDKPMDEKTETEAKAEDDKDDEEMDKQPNEDDKEKDNKPKDEKNDKEEEAKPENNKDDKEMQNDQPKNVDDDSKNKDDKVKDDKDDKDKDDKDKEDKDDKEDKTKKDDNETTTKKQDEGKADSESEGKAATNSLNAAVLTGVLLAALLN